MTESEVTAHVRDYWEQGSCGTDATKERKYSEAYFREIEAFRYRVEPFIHQFAQFSRWHRKDILEVGVGAGTDFLQFVRSGARAHGVDVTDEAVRNVRSRLAQAGLSAVDLRRCNAEALPYPDGKFDLVYSWGVIHHAEHTWRCFSELVRVTRPGGTVKVMLYNRSSLHTWYLALRYALPAGRLRAARDWALSHHQESPDTKAYTESDVRRVMQAYPHRDLSFSYFDQHVRPGAKLYRTRAMLSRVCPDRLRWYMGFEFEKVRGDAQGAPGR